MSKTRIFKSGNSQAVRIPADMTYADMGIALARLRELARPDIIETREPIAFPERDWS